MNLGLSPIWETFITTISYNDKFPTFDELVGKCSKEETRMISGWRNQKHEEGESFAFGVKERKKKGKGRSFNSRNPTSMDSQRIFKKDKVECFKCHRYRHFAKDSLENENTPRSN